MAVLRELDVVLIVGLGIVAVPTGQFAFALSKAREGE
jgi:hypothetical protein